MSQYIILQICNPKINSEIIEVKKKFQLASQMISTHHGTTNKKLSTYQNGEASTVFVLLRFDSLASIFIPRFKFNPEIPKN